MKLFNVHFSDRSSKNWIVKLEPDEIKRVEADGFSVRIPYAVYWRESKYSLEKLCVLKQRWEDHSYLLK